MEIRLTDDIEKALVAEAKERGTTPEQLALDSLRREFVHSEQRGNSVEDQGSKGSQGTLAEYLSGFIGVLHSREHIPNGARLSEATGEAFARAMVDKRRRGRL